MLKKVGAVKLSNLFKLGKFKLGKFKLPSKVCEEHGNCRDIGQKYGISVWT